MHTRVRGDVVIDASKCKNKRTVKAVVTRTQDPHSRLKGRLEVSFSNLNWDITDSYVEVERNRF